VSSAVSTRLNVPRRDQIITVLHAPVAQYDIGAMMAWDDDGKEASLADIKLPSAGACIMVTRREGLQRGFGSSAPVRTLAARSCFSEVPSVLEYKAIANPLNKPVTTTGFNKGGYANAGMLPSMSTICGHSAMAQVSHGRMWSLASTVRSSSVTMSRPAVRPTVKPSEDLTTGPVPSRNPGDLVSGRGSSVASDCAPDPGSAHSDDDDKDDALRETIGEILQSRDMRNKGVSLALFSYLTHFSTCTLSLWRRRMYRGNSRLIARAVEKALATVRKWRFEVPMEVVRAQRSYNRGSSSGRLTRGRMGSDDVE